MPVTRAVPPPPPAGVPLVDETGRLTSAWQAWLIALMAFLAEVKAQVP